MMTFKKHFLFTAALAGILAFFACFAGTLLADEYKILAVVNDEIITNYDVDKYLLPMAQQYAKMYSEETLDEKMSELSRTILDRLIEEKLILQEAKRIGYKIEKKEINEQFDKIMAKFPSREQFEVSLERQGLTTKTLKKQIEDSLMVQKMTGYFVGRHIDISDSDIESYYEQHLSDYTAEPEYRVRHIFLPKKGREPLMISQEMSELQSHLQKGEDFGEAAKKYSQGPNAPAGGDLGFIKLSQIQKELSDKIPTMNILEVAGPIENESGFHFLKLEAKKEQTVRPLSAVKGDIKNVLYKDSMTEKRKVWVDELKAKNFVEIK